MKRLEQGQLDPPANFQAPQFPSLLAQPGLIRWILFLVALWLLSFARFPVQRILVGLDHPWYQLDNEEGALLWQTLELHRGRSIYRPLTEYPLVVGTYPPLFMAFCAPFVSLDAPSFFPGRLVAALSLGIASICLLVILRRSTRSWIPPLLALGLFSATFELYSWSPYCRVDMTALALNLVGLAFLFGERLPGTRAAMAASIAFTLAFYTKQTAVVAPLGTLVAMSVYVSPARAAKEALKLLILVGAPFLILTLMTDGQFFLHTVAYNANRMNWHELVLWARHISRFYPWWLALAALSLSVLVRYAGPSARWRHRCPPSGDASSFVRPGSEAAADAESPPTQFPADDSAAAGQSADRDWSAALATCYFLMSLLNFPALAKAGSAENYLLEPLVAAALLVGLAAGRLCEDRLAHRCAAPAASLVLAAFALLHAIHVTERAPIMFSPAKNPDAQDFENAARLVARLRATDGPVVSELGGYAIFAGKALMFQPFIMSELARQGRWDPSLFLRDLERGRFGAIVTTVDLATDAFSDAVTDSMRRAIVRSYECRERMESGRLWRYYLYRPRPAPGGNESR